MAEKVISCLNVEGLTEKIIHARRGVCYASPGVYDWVAEALIAAAECAGWDHVRVVIDASPDVIRFGYGTKQVAHRWAHFAFLCGSSSTAVDRGWGLVIR